MAEVIALPARFNSTVAVLVHIVERVVARVVHNNVENNSDSVLVSSVNKSSELLGSTEVSVGLCIVENVVAVI